MDNLVQERMERALKLSREAWENAGMPYIFSCPKDDVAKLAASSETGKIALAILAVEIFRNLHYDMFGKTTK